jgi:hypothetical protein
VDAPALALSRSARRDGYLAGLFKDVRPEPRRRHRAWTQRDITRLIRGAKAAGIEARVELTPDGRLILIPEPLVPNGAGDDDDILARLT